MARKIKTFHALSEISTSSEKGDTPPADHLVILFPASLLSSDSSQAQVYFRLDAHSSGPMFTQNKSGGEASSHMNKRGGHTTSIPCQNPLLVQAVSQRPSQAAGAFSTLSKASQRVHTQTLVSASPAARGPTFQSDHLFLLLLPLTFHTPQTITHLSTPALESSRTGITNLILEA